MPILALPVQTARLLSSAQVLTDPASVVKELVDNALDARATSIEVSVSGNTLDKIEVRDNGHGITAEDLAVLGRRGHTSKLRTFEDLQTVGGISLGFRGEAVSSATVLCQVSVTTRTEGQNVATLVVLHPQGGIASSSLTSHPVGTTFLLSNLFSQIPVRRQHFAKDVAKQIIKIKDLLQRYAVARRHVRFKMKIIKKQKFDWIYSPRPKDGIRETVAQIFGRDLAAQCIEASSLSSASEPSREESFDHAHLSRPSSRFVFEAFLPSPGADLTRISKGQYLSVDSRPVSGARGTLKKLVTAYKAHLRGTSPGTCKALNPFLYLDIKCPIGSYDPNTEPAKSDVMFVDELGFMNAVEAFFARIYNRDEDIVASRDLNPEALEVQPSIDFTHNLPREDLLEDCLPALKVVPATRHEERRKTVYARSDESIARTEIQAILDAGSHEASMHGARGSDQNIFRLNAPFSEFAQSGNETNKNAENRSKLGNQTDHQYESYDENEQVDVDELRSKTKSWTTAKNIDPTRLHASLRSHRINSRCSSEMADTCTSPQVQQTFPQTPRFLGRQGVRTSSSHRREASGDEHETPVQSNLQRWIQSVPQRSTPHVESCVPVENHDPDDEMLLEDVGPQAFPASTSNRSEPTKLCSIASGGMLSPPTTQERPTRKRAGGVSNQFVSPLRKIKGTTILAGEQFHTTATIACSPSLLNAAYHQDPRLISADIAPSARRYQRRIEGYREVVIPERPLHLASANERAPPKTTLPDGDPRAYLLRRQKSLRGAPAGIDKLQRSKTALLPFETVSEQARLHNLEHLISIASVEIEAHQKRLSQFDTYTLYGRQPRTYDMSAEELVILEEMFETLSKKWKLDENKACEIEYDFSSVIEARRVSMATSDLIC